MTNEKASAAPAQVLANVATTENRLFQTSYIKGVAEFVEKCATPMAIAIQGDTGAGKSTLINLLEKEFRAEEDEREEAQSASAYCEDIIGVAIVDVLVRSTAEPGSDLFMHLLSQVVPMLSGSDLATMAKVSEFASAASQIADAVGTDEPPAEDDSLLSAILSLVFGNDESSGSKASPDAEKEELITSLGALRDTLAEALQQSAQKNGKSDDSRFVVFIDGLDHIDPSAALALMEQVKAYIDCPRCVFVYAVDENTVLEGIRKKYGNRSDGARERMIFDKLVQVPLYIPASTYNLEKFIGNLLTDEDEKKHAGEFVEVVDTLLRSPTPHRIKRYLNTMYLYRSIFGGSEAVEDGQLAMLFAAVILRLESPQGFDAVLRCAWDDEERFAENLQAALEAGEIGDGVDLAKLSTLWDEGSGAGADSAKRAAFLSWVRKLG